MSRREDNSRIECPGWREDVHEIEQELLFRMEDVRRVGVRPSERRIVRLDLDLLPLWLLAHIVSFKNVPSPLIYFLKSSSDLLFLRS